MPDKLVENLEAFINYLHEYKAKHAEEYHRRLACLFWQKTNEQYDQLVLANVAKLDYLTSQIAEDAISIEMKQANAGLLKAKIIPRLCNAISAYANMPAIVETQKKFCQELVAQLNNLDEGLGRLVMSNESVPVNKSPKF